MSDETVPTPYRIIVRKDDGTETDVTEGVKVLYDHTVTSMDWGSGFLEVEDAAEVITVALTCGFLVPETAQEQFEDYAVTDQRREWTCIDCGRRVFHHPYGKHKGLHHGESAPAYRDPLVAEAADHPARLWRAT
ncbi:MAG: hypothetical protein H7233_15905 [Pseudorhodobacter sp.]|nr:hypothetical protein [Frankiaceae bacterium]